ncbi:MAG: alpha/beta hydrolase [Actinomycetes bacterium]
MTPWSRQGTALAVAALLIAGCATGGNPGAKPSHRSAAASSSAPAGTTTPPPEGGLARFYDQKVSWRDCGDGFQCGEVVVPIDYAQPRGKTIRLSVNRLRASGSNRIGSLLINPGGPGVSGVDYARAADSVISGAVRRRFDIVGFDPRGVERSAPIRCLNDKQTDEFVEADASPDNAGEESHLVRVSRQLGERCAARNGALLAHVGTRDAARDLDVLRAVVGDKKLNFLGKSYGTFLGATYAEMFPRNVGRVVLDGVVDPAADTTALARAQAIGFETALGAFVDDCLRRRSCPLSGDRATALSQVSDVLARSDRTPLKASRPVDQSLVLLGIAYAMYDKGLWEILREGLGEARKGRGDLLLLLADTYSDRNQKGHYTSNTNDVIYAVNCLDRSETSDLAVIRARAAAFAKVAPRFGPYVAWSSLPCGYWPVPPQSKAGPVRASGAAPILVVGTTRDPATPYAFAKNLAGELDAARLLTYDGDGHTAYRQGSDCIDRSVDHFLLDATLPPEGTRCR